MHAIRSTVATARSTAGRYLAELREQRQLERELAEYRSDSDRQDLYAMLSRHTAEEVAPIERILNRQNPGRGLAHHR